MREIAGSIDAKKIWRLKISNILERPHIPPPAPARFGTGYFVSDFHCKSGDDSSGRRRPARNSRAKYASDCHTQMILIRIARCVDTDNHSQDFVGARSSYAAPITWEFALKNRIVALFALGGMTAAAPAVAVDPADVVRGYADIAHAGYADSLTAA